MINVSTIFDISNYGLEFEEDSSSHVITYVYVLSDNEKEINKLLDHFKFVQHETTLALLDNTYLVYFITKSFTKADTSIRVNAVFMSSQEAIDYYLQNKNRFCAVSFGV